MGLTTVYVLIRHASGPRVLGGVREGKLQLPTIEHEADWWLPGETESVVKKVRSQYGIDATLLRHVRREEPQVCEMEIRSQGAGEMKRLDQKGVDEVVGLAAEVGHGRAGWVSDA